MVNDFLVLCEYQENPIGIDCLTPRFSWIYEDDRIGLYQANYRITVAKSIQELDDKRNLCWHTETVLSDQTVNVEYQGERLESATIYYFKVVISLNN